MKVAIYAEDDLKHIVLTPESETERSICEKLHDGCIMNTPIPTGPVVSPDIQAGPRRGSDISYQCSDRSRSPMTELERARAHLRQSQFWLRQHRLWQGAETSAPWPGDQVVDDGIIKYRCELYEDAVLAALSWVWEEQQSADLEERKTELRTWLDGIIEERFP
jgi:hypothetical protein